MLIPIWVRGATEDQRGLPLPNTSETTVWKVGGGDLSAYEANPTFTMPFRLFSAVGTENVVNLVFEQRNEAVTSLQFAVLHWRGYRNTAKYSPRLISKSVTNLDELRANNMPLEVAYDAQWWTREVTEEVGSDGAVTHNLVTRTLNRPYLISAKRFSSLITVPIVLEAQWAALTLWYDGVVEPLNAVYVDVGGNSDKVQEILDCYQPVDSAPYDYATKIKPYSYDELGQWIPLPDSAFL
jgi:hypothetical protein